MTIDVNGVCQILRECANLNISELSYCNLHVKFHTVDNSVRSTEPTIAPSIDQSAQTNLADPDVNDANTDVGVNIEDEREFRERQLEMMRLTNPLHYEELISKGELEDVREEQEDT